MDTGINVSNEISPLAALIERARNQQLSVTDVFQGAEMLTRAGRPDQAMDLYKSWIAFNSNHPLVHMVYFNYSVTLRQVGDTAGAINALRACLKAEPMFGAAHVNLGRALEDSGLLNDALQQWRSYAASTAEINPDKLAHRVMVLEHIGRVLENAGMMEEAETTLWQAIELRPEKKEAGQHWSAIRLRQCKWPALEGSHYVTVRQLLDAVSPLTIACYTDDPLFHLAKAQRYNRTMVGKPDLGVIPPQLPRKKTGTGQRLRVGYLSSDLRDHAVGFALREVLELHDKATVEVFAYYCGDPITPDETQRRIRSAVDGWREIAALSDVDAARLIVNDEIDILVDVNGYTKHARTRIFAYRPAPVIVNFCGYPGTMASPFHQYMIADNVIVPPEHEIYYSEKVLRIPCNQPVDRKRVVAPRPTRAEVGLPEDAFVFACFNGMQKITQACFTRWMSILNAVPGSVLWILSGDDAVNQRLRDAATRAGVDAARLLFAAKALNAHHLARIAVADLFLDTFPYGAHSTAADAINMGLPVLTFPGKSFASRFCASVVAAAGVPELIATSPDDYTRRAIAFGLDRASLQPIRDSLKRQFETSALRDMPGLARRLEELYWQMQGECERGETPVPQLLNMDAYYEIGAEFSLENREFEDEASYRQRFHEKLVQWNSYAPLLPDGRLWTGADA
ncbi:putative O-linked N-acetylglucosamine transferase (SPINDLY family) [Rhizobium taibaishanense]|nr:putative O-linked N-acetylglucosamine transferase (SPINDLY family) [Allorhizobium taibaishanense]